MSSSHDIDSPDSLQLLLRKSHAIYTVNKENIAHIEARIGQKVIVKHQYTLQTQPHANKKQKVQDSSNSNDGSDMFELVDKATTKNVDDIIAAWRYHGEPLIKEKIAIDNFIERKLVCFDDLVRLNDKYGDLLDKYSRLLTDEVESRAAVKVVMCNMEQLQVAIGDVHGRVLDAADNEKVNEAMELFLKNMSKEWTALQSKVGGVNFNVDIKGNIAEVGVDRNVVSFHDCGAISCKRILSGHDHAIFALQPYVLNGKQYLASATLTTPIKLWDLSNNTVAATLTGHRGYVYALALYVHNGIQMLASGSDDKTIKLWDLSSNTCMHTLLGHRNGVLALAVYETENKTVLVSGSDDKIIKAWDVDSHTIITTLQGHEDVVMALAVYNHDGKAYLASGSHDKTIKIWSLDDYSIVRTLDNDDLDVILSLQVVNVDGKQILASGDFEGKIKLWNVADYECIGTIAAHSSTIYVLNVVECDGKVCLVSGSLDKTIKVWDLESQSVLTTLDNNSGIRSMAVFMNGDRACMATGEYAKKIKLWME